MDIPLQHQLIYSFCSEWSSWRVNGELPVEFYEDIHLFFPKEILFLSWSIYGINCLVSAVKRLPIFHFNAQSKNAKLHQGLYYIPANSKGSDENALMRRLAWVFAGCLCDKYLFLMCWLNYGVSCCVAVVKHLPIFHFNVQLSSCTLWSFGITVSFGFNWKWNIPQPRARSCRFNKWIWTELLLRKCIESLQMDLFKIKDKYGV